MDAKKDSKLHLLSQQKQHGFNGVYTGVYTGTGSFSANALASGMTERESSTNTMFNGQKSQGPIGFGISSGPSSYD